MSEYVILNDDCLNILREMDDNSVDSIVTDTPYGLGKVKDINSLLTSWMTGNDGNSYVGSNGFMGEEWDKSVPSPKIWKECLRVLKPGGHLLVFAGTRTQDLMGVSIRIAGFELRDEISYVGNVLWVYGSGFPKGLNIGKKVDEIQGNEREKTHTINRANHNQGTTYARAGCKDTGVCEYTKGISEWEGWNVALKPAHEPILMFRKPLSEKNVALNVLKWGCGGINVDDSRIEANGELKSGINQRTKGQESVMNASRDWSLEKPFYYEGGKGRFPANIILDDSEEVRGCFPETKSGTVTGYNFEKSKQGDVPITKNIKSGVHFGDSSSASRFFKCCPYEQEGIEELKRIWYFTKASKKDRNEGLEEKKMGMSNGAKIHGDGYDKAQDIGLNRVISRKNYHPTVKSTSLLKYIVKMVTRKGGTVLDPFMGSGSTGKACMFEGFDFIGIEQDKGYCEIAEARIEHVRKKREAEEKKPEQGKLI